MKDLPKDDRGYTVPAEAPWSDGAPLLAGFDKARTLAIATGSACSQCGLRLDGSEGYWRVFSQRNAAYARLTGSTVEFAAPGHELCMTYAALACPFWSSAQARLGASSLIEPGAARGKLPALMAFRVVDLLVRPGVSPLAAGRPSFAFMYSGVAVDRPFQSPSSGLLDRYEEMIASVGEAELRSDMRVYVAGDEAGHEQLDDLLVARLTALFARRGATMVVNDQYYQGFRLYEEWRGR